MGLSPVLATVTVTVGRPALSSISPSAGMISPGMMDGDELCAVREGRFHLNIMDHLRHAFHHLVARQDMRACLHELRNSLPVARAFQNEIADDGDGFRMVQLKPAIEPPARDYCGHGNQKLVLLARR